MYLLVLTPCRRKKAEEEAEKERKRQEKIQIQEERRRQREERRRQRRLEKRRKEEERQMQLRIKQEERRILIAQRKLETIRLLSELFNRIKVGRQPARDHGWVWAQPIRQAHFSECHVIEINVQFFF